MEHSRWLILPWGHLSGYNNRFFLVKEAKQSICQLGSQNASSASVSAYLQENEHHEHVLINTVCSLDTRVHMSLCGGWYTCVQVPKEARGIGSLGTAITGGCEPPA